MRAIEIINGRPAAQILAEGGNSFPDVGTIHIDEIEPTLKEISEFLQMPDVVNNAIGSVGKSEYSGDIDIVVNLSSDEMKELSVDLRNKLGSQNVKGVAGNVTFRWPISNYDKEKQERQPRTGKVQVDLIPGEPEWYKTYYHSPGDASKLKGHHRNLAVAGLATSMDYKRSEEEDQWGRPIESIRWMWGQKNGLTKIRKKARRNERTGEWIKKQETEYLSKPLKDPEKIAQILFRGKANADALNSVETIVDAIKKAYNKTEQKEIFQNIARSFGTRFPYDVLTGFDIPKEIKQYIEE